jgi:4-methyl-5(b-hydroxyethyl)-thiazole monophosphate biosynthesis
VLHDAGILDGKRYTAHQTARQELTAALDDRVVVDGNLVTSRGAGTAIDFGLRLVEELVDAGEAARISLAIMA